MEKKNDEIEAVKAIMKTLYSAQRALRALAPEYNWAGLGNLLGDYGEYVATNHYGLTKAPAGSGDYDAKTKEGRTVQIKTNHAANQIGYRGNADLMLVIHVTEDGEWEEVYFGDFTAVKKSSTFSSRDNKFMIGITKLRSLQKSNRSDSN